MTKKEIYNELHKIDAIAELETKPGVWYIKNTVSEYHTNITSYYPTLKDAIGGLMKSSDWFCPNGTGTIIYREFGIHGCAVEIYSGGFENEFGKVLI